MQPDRIALIDEDASHLLDELIQARLGPGARYTFFFGAGEGRYLPGTRIEEESGYVLTSEDRVFYFWLGWDVDAGTPTLTRWREQAPAPRWVQIGEYQRARARLGLT